MYIIKVRKLPEVIKDKLFDICYEIIWVKKMDIVSFYMHWPVLLLSGVLQISDHVELAGCSASG